MLQTIPKTMNAVAIDKFGGEETMKYRTSPVPEAGKGEILIKVESAGVGVWDPMEREGLFAQIYGLRPPFPHVLGSDGAGTVVVVGAGVKRFKVGDRVYGMSFSAPKGGFYAEYAIIDEAHAVPVPKKLTTEQAGVLAVDAATALRGLDAVALKKGESIMIVGAGGGIGHLAVQFAKRLGARVFAVASGEDGVALAKKLGADATAERKTDVAAAARKFTADGIDTALVTAGGESVDKALSALKKNGRVSAPNGVMPAPKPSAGITVKTYNADPDLKLLERINQLIEAAGPFHVNVARTYPLSKVLDALHALDTHYLGKLALRPD